MKIILLGSGLALLAAIAVSCSSTSSGGGTGGAGAGGSGAGDGGGAVGGSGGGTCTHSPDCGGCATCYDSCVCGGGVPTTCLAACNAGTGGSSGSSGTGGGTGCTHTPDCGGCTSCYDSCVCGGTDPNTCLSTCSGTGGTGGTGGTSGTSGTGGTGGGGTAPLGQACTSTAQCGSGMICVTAGSTTFDNEGAANGYCTATCTTNADCDALSSGAGCVQNQNGTAYCYQGCQWGNASGSLNPNKCFGRLEVACAGYISNPEAGSTADTFLCSPTCNVDADCGSGLYCNYGTGHCSTTKPTGSPVGTACNPKNATDPCAGFCIGFGDPDPTKGLCSGLCTIGSLGNPGTCGSDPTSGSPQAAACLFVEDTSEQLGDLGFCGQLCDCDSQCAAGFVCAPFSATDPSGQLESLLNRKGECLEATSADGGVNGGISTCP